MNSSPEFWIVHNVFIYLGSIRKSLRLVVCDATGWVGLYSLDQEEGGDCSLIRQFLLIDSDTGDQEDIETEQGTDSGNASDSGNVSETGSRTSPAPGANVRSIRLSLR